MMMRVVLISLILMGVVALAFPSVVGVDIRLPDRADIEHWIEVAGLAGPFIVVVLMTIAIVASPLPSAPIALAAGAAYGHTLGTILVVLGAELGALAAFGLARSLGRPFVERHLGQKINTGLFGSQNSLTFLVFGSRLLPFLSFDMISYAAGLSKLHLWRFALSTLAGIIPASFLLAHMGNQAMNGDARTATWTALSLGGFTGMSVLFAATRKNGTQRKES